MKYLDYADLNYKPSKKDLACEFLLEPCEEIFENDAVIQASVDVHERKLGTKAGAKAMGQALEALIKKVLLGEQAKSHKKLKISLEVWKK